MPRAKVMPAIEGVDVDFLSSFMSSLEEVEQVAAGYGALVSCKIVAEDSGHPVVATYRDHHWSIRVGEGVAS